jgi:hypothetical protein
MGIKDYFKGRSEEVSEAEKRSTTSGGRTDNIEMAPSPQLGVPSPMYASSRNSYSAPSTRSSTFIDDIKHEVMVNYLYQQQCSHLWVSDGSGELEGVLLRKTRGNYMACPQQLAQSAFATACNALNVQVSQVHKTLSDAKMGANKFLGCDDSQLEGDQNFPPMVS